MTAVWALCMVAAVAGQVRTWTDVAGVRTDGELVGVAAEKFWVQRADDLLLLPEGDFCPTDRAFVAEYRRRQRGDFGAAEAAEYAAGCVRATLANRAITESSGLAASRRRRGVFWTHNDSGGEPRLFAFDLAGRDVGSLWLTGVTAFDWEAVACFLLDGAPHLLVADTGNNGLHAGVQMLHLVEEPELSGGRELRLPPKQTIYVAYSDDYRNCEAVACDPDSRTVLLISQEKKVGCRVYAFGLPAGNAPKLTVARPIAALGLPKVTDMDLSPDGRRAVVLTYGDAYLYTRQAGEDWAAAFARRPRRVALPPRRQGEGVCFGPDGRTLYLTSERSPAPLIEVPWAGAVPAEP